MLPLVVIAFVVFILLIASVRVAMARAFAEKMEPKKA